MKKKNFLIKSLLALILVSCGGTNDTTSSSSSSSDYFSEEITLSSEGIISNYTSDSSSSESFENSSNEVLSNDVSSDELLSSEELSSEGLSSEELSSEEISSSGDKPIEVMETPNLKLDDSTGVVTWDEIPNATHYNYIINDGEIKSTTSSTIALNNESTISVQAANSEIVSSWSYAVTYFDTSDIEVDATKDVYVYFHNANIDPIVIESGTTIDKPTNPTKQNCTFENWYKDAFYQDVFDFSSPIFEDTILYANYNEDDLIKDTYFWIKANNKITSSVIGNTSSSGWKFIPLKRNESQNSFIEFYATITVSGASTSDPAKFLVMDGFDDISGRTYWKNNGSDFSINSDGIYNIYFSLENQYMLEGNIVHVYYELSNNTYLNYLNNGIYGNNTLSTPIVSVDYNNNIASWNPIDGALNYEVIINNGTPNLISNNYITLNKGEHITVRAKGLDTYSNWSKPNANIKYIVKEEEKTEAFVYFFDSNTPAMKVSIGEQINAVDDPIKEDYTFEGWYLDIALNNKAEFPYIVLDNTVFYPKWTYNYDYTTKVYYNLCDSNGNVVSGLTWNIDNFDFYEYETPSVVLSSSEQYYIKPLDESSTYGPYTVSSDGTYKIYFSEDYVWNANSENESHVYIQSEKLVLYFSNNKGWSGTIKAYMWNSSTGEYAKEWPGSEMEYVKTNSYGEKIYKVEVDLSLYDYIIFTDGSNQTNNIPLAGVESGTGFYITDGRNYGTYEFA